MASLDQLRYALKQADQAGDTQGAQKLAEAYRRQLAAEGGEAPLTPGGLVKAGATGLRLGTEAIAGSPGDVGELGKTGIEKGGSFLGVGEKERNAMGDAFRVAMSPTAKIVMALRAMGLMEGSPTDVKSLPSGGTAEVGKVTDAGLQKVLPEGANATVQDITRHKPANTGEKFMTTGMSFVPAAAAGNPAGIVRRAAGEFATGVVSEGAGQATKGSAFEPLARIITGLLGSAAMSSAVRKGPVRPPEPDWVGGRPTVAPGGLRSAGEATGSKTLQSVERGVQTGARRAAANAPSIIGGGAMLGHLPAALATIAAPIGGNALLRSAPVQKLLMSAPEDTRAMLTAIIAANQGDRGIGR